MGRKRGKGRHPGGHNNNRWGSHTVGFDGDHHMHGADTSPTRNHHGSGGRGGRGGRGRPYSNHGRGAPRAYRGGNNNQNHSHATFSGPQHHNNHHGQNHMHNPFHNPFNSTSPNDRPNHRGRGGRGRGRGGSRFGNRNTTDSYDNEDSGIDGVFDFSPSPHSSSTHSSSHSCSGSTVRFCIECRDVRRANLRFRNWAARALQRCSERFVAWADEAGVAFGTGDEMDWQPEPVTRVLLLYPPLPNFGAAPAMDTQHDMQRQRLEDQERFREQILQWGGSPHGGIGLGPMPVPGPWPWPPWSAAAAVQDLRTAYPVTEWKKPLTRLGPECAHGMSGNCGEDGGVRGSNEGVSAHIPVSSRLGMLGATGVGGTTGFVTGPLAGARWAGVPNGRKPSIPTRAAFAPAAVTSTCDEEVGTTASSLAEGLSLGIWGD
ncbi:hypothetical protein GGR54DRAFT_643606 [Hypoxylon sp. NC1633]|nr:hypothetical protein GGR54DRAFT_643606 [Hypoxylon sp. NC1633]